MDFPETPGALTIRTHGRTVSIPVSQLENLAGSGSLAKRVAQLQMKMGTTLGSLFFSDGLTITVEVVPLKGETWEGLPYIPIITWTRITPPEPNDG